MFGYLFTTAFSVISLGGLAVHILAPATTLGRLLSIRGARYAYIGSVILVFILLARYLMSKGVKFYEEKRNA